MILQIVIDIVMGIAETLINIIMAVFPEINLATHMIEYTTKIISVCGQANNFIHFMLGDIVVVLVPLTISLLAWKYLVYPIIVFIRSIFVNGNN